MTAWTATGWDDEGRQATRIPPSGETRLDSLSDALEAHTETLMAAIEQEGELAARRETEHGDAMADLAEEGVAPSARKEVANARVAALTAELVRADRRVKMRRVRWDASLARLVAEQSALKFFGAQDGGAR